jgi:ABC-type uncharacterized transport system involved in gliding motility auxiliary subunit
VTLDEPIPAEVDVLFLLAPRDLEEKQVYHIDQFVLRGGRLLLLLDPADLENVWHGSVSRNPFESRGVEPYRSGLEDWLEHLGVTVEHGVVGDFDPAAVARYPKPPDAREWITRYPYWFHTDPERHSQSSPLTKDLPPITFFWPAPISVDEAKHSAAGRTVSALVTTTASGYKRPDLVGVGQADEVAAGKTLESIPLVVMVEGPMSSYWKGKPVPGTEPAKEEGGADDAASGDAEAGGPDEGAGEAGGGTERAPDGPDAPGGQEAPDAPPEAPDEPGGAPPPGKEGDGDEEADGEEPSPAAAEEEPAAPAGPPRLEEGRGRILLATDAEFASNTVGPTSGLSEHYGLSGFDLALRAPGYLLGDEDLLDVPVRTRKARRLEDVDKAKQHWLAVLNILGVPFLVLMAGLTVFFVRRS